MELLRTRLRRSAQNEVLTGSLGGLAEFFGVEARKIRIAYFLGCLFTGGALILFYPLLWYVMPDDLSRSGHEPDLRP